MTLRGLILIVHLSFVIIKRNYSIKVHLKLGHNVLASYEPYEKTGPRGCQPCRSDTNRAAQPHNMARG